MKTNQITENGSGLERYNLICEHYGQGETLYGMLDLMQSLTYTRAYPSSMFPSHPFWYTEFVGNRGLTVKSTPGQYAPVIEEADGYFTHRVRGDGKTWQTVHCSVYDMEKKELYLRTQEVPDTMIFKF